MGKRIHFEDDIFYLNTRIRNLTDMLSLDVDPDFFLEKTMDDLSFFHTSLGTILQSLLANDKFIEREEQLLNLAETEECFQGLLKTVLSGYNEISLSLQSFSDQLNDFRQCSAQRGSEIEGATAFKNHEADDPLVVSSMELNELLKGME
jgi:hypothetical protein